MTQKSGVGQRLMAIRGDRTLVAWGSEIGSNKSSWGDYEKERTVVGIDVLIRAQRVQPFDLNWLATGQFEPEGAAPAPTPPEGLDIRVLELAIGDVMLMERATWEQGKRHTPRQIASMVIKMYDYRIKNTVDENKPIAESEPVPTTGGSARVNRR